MKNFLKYFSLFLIIIFGSLQNNFAQDVPANVKELATAKLVKWASTNETINAVKSQYSKDVSLDRIKEIDNKWMATTGSDDFFKQYCQIKC